MKQKETNNSTLLEEVRIIAHNADGFLLFPTRRNIDEQGALEAFHTHLYYEFFFATDMPLTIVTERGAENFSGSIIIVPPSVKHFCCCEGEGGYRIAATASEVHQIGEANGLLDYIQKDCLTVLPINEAIEYYLKNLVAEDMFLRFGRAKGEAFLKLLFLEIATLLSVKDNGLVGETVNPKYCYVEKIDRFIGENFNKPEATIGNLAKALCLSERQTARILKKEYGCTFAEMVNAKKMLVAAILLKKSELSVQEIVQQLRYETENYFYRLFKKYYGVTPLKYRKQMR